jgi:hypothetical protein
MPQAPRKMGVAGGMHSKINFNKHLGDFWESWCEESPLKESGFLPNWQPIQIVNTNPETGSFYKTTRLKLLPSLMCEQATVSSGERQAPYTACYGEGQILQRKAEKMKDVERCLCAGSLKPQKVFKCYCFPHRLSM